MDILLVGLKDLENEEIARWVMARGGRVWNATTALSALRVYEEFEPGTVVLNTLLPDMDSVRLARTLHACNADLRIIFVGAHQIEARYFETIDGLGNVRYAHRPVDPAAALDLEPTESELHGTPLQGEITSPVLISLFVTLLRDGNSGALYAGTGPNRRVIYFDHGRPIWASSTIASETLGQMLLASGRISRVEFDWTRNIQAREGVLQGTALTRIGVLNESELEDLLRAQIEEKILALFTMGNAQWHFERWDRSMRQIRGYDFNGARILLDGIRRCGAFDHLDASLAARLGNDPDDALLTGLLEFLPPGTSALLQTGATVEQLGTHFHDMATARACIGVLQAANVLV